MAWMAETTSAVRGGPKMRSGRASGFMIQWVVMTSVQLGDVVAGGGSRARHRASTEDPGGREPHDDAATGVDQERRRSGLDERGRPGSVRIRERVSGTEDRQRDRHRYDSSTLIIARHVHLAKRGYHGQRRPPAPHPDDVVVVGTAWRCAVSAVSGAEAARWAVTRAWRDRPSSSSSTSLSSSPLRTSRRWSTGGRASGGARPAPAGGAVDGSRRPGVARLRATRLGEAERLEPFERPVDELPRHRQTSDRAWRRRSAAMS